MISFFRRWLTSPPALILLALVLVAFAVTGVGDPFGGGKVAAGSLARIGDRTLTEADLTKAFDRAMQQARAQNPQVSQVEVARQGGVATVADQLIGSTALEALARQAGLVASDRAVGAEIAAIPAFQTAGAFDERVYRERLAQNRISDRELRDDIAGNLLRRQLVTPLSTALAMPQGMAAAYAHILTDAHVGGVVLIPTGGTSPASEAEIAAFYARNKARFTLPERRGFRWAEIDKAALAAAVKVSDAEIAAAYAKDPAKYGAAPTRVLEQVVVPDEAQAKTIAAAAAKEGFAAAAQRVAGFGAADIAVGSRDQAAFAKETSAEVAAAAFALPAGGVSAPIRTDFGWHVVRVASIGGAGKSLAAARPAIDAELRKLAVTKAVSDLVARIEDGVESGKSFADLARENGLAIKVQSPVSEAGASGSGPADPALAPVAAKAFRHEPADGPAVEELKDGGADRLIVIETAQVLASAPAPLAEIRGIVAGAAAREKALLAGKRIADTIVATVAKGGDFAAAVARAGLPKPQPARARRIDIAQMPNAPDVLKAFVSVPAKTVRAIPTPAGWLLLHVASVTPDATGTAEIVEGVRRDVASVLPEEFGQALARAAERDLKTTRSAKLVADVTARLSGQDTTR
ncbi:hypothetical protein IP88_05580 [alpha proteobacterium AAP81b]|nr:hypothetical protein IP88_05580 [alpha proteobacterium AAP81b]